MNITPDSRLSECPQTTTSVQLPSPLRQRLDELTDLLYDAEGEKVSMKELVCTLVLEAPEDTQDLLAAVRRYRRAVAAKAAVAQRGSANVLAFNRRKPGPRRRKAAGD